MEMIMWCKRQNELVHKLSTMVQNWGQNKVLCKEPGKKLIVQKNIYNIYNFNLLQFKCLSIFKEVIWTLFV